MPPPETADRRGAVAILLGAVLFAVAHTQSPLYFSNQHQYFLHGLAQADHGDLAHDWLANTADPTPAFSFVVSVTATYLHPNLFHAYYFAILVLYGICLAKIAGEVFPQSAGSRTIAVLCLIALVHSGIVRWASVRLTGVDYPWFLQAGVAGQYLLGPGLQPSAFGVLMLASLAACLAKRPYLAALLAAAAGLMHFTYFLTAASLITAYALPEFMASRWRFGMQILAVGVGAMLPGVVYSAVHFAPTTMANVEAAHTILVIFRIPHHTLPSRWFDLVAGLQVTWIAVGIALSWRTRLFPVLLVVSGFSLLLTILQLLQPTYFVALLFPWRASVVLMPIATSLIVGRVVSMLGARLEKPVTVAGWFLLMVLAAAGVWIMAARQAYHPNPDELQLLKYVRTHRKSGDVYLLPIKPPKASTKRGSMSASFTPPPRSHTEKHLIAVDLQRFRLHTGAAIFVDFKSIPYKDIEVLEWRKRLALVERWYAQNDWEEPTVQREIQAYGITHIVAESSYVPFGPSLVLEYRDHAYSVYRLGQALPRPMP